MNIGMEKNKVNVVIDTNILISGIIFGGNPEYILNLAIAKGIKVFTSPILLAELLEVFFKKFHFSYEKLQQVEVLIKTHFVMIYPHTEIHVLQDEPDNRLLELAIDSNSQIIISGDKKLLALRTYKKIIIISSFDFIKLLRSYSK